MVKLRKSKFNLITLCLTISTFLILNNLMIPIKAEDPFLWTAHVPSTNEPITSPILAVGIEYDITISERFWYDYPNNLAADAQYYTTNSSDSLNWVNYFSLPNRHSFLQINGNDVQLGSYNPGHGYSTSYIGKGEPITLQVVDWIDGDYSNNFCHFEIKIKQLESQSYTLIIEESEFGTTNPVPGIYAHIPGYRQEITAISNPGYSFENWELDGQKFTENPLRVIMNNNHQLLSNFIDDIPPQIGKPILEPNENPQAYQPVTVTVEVSDLGAGVNNTVLLYRTNDETVWTSLNMAEVSQNTYSVTIPGFSNQTVVTCKIIAQDNNSNTAIGTDFHYGYNTQHVPEFSNYLIIFPFLAMLTIAIFIGKKKFRK
jgi:hypothetical protein